MTNSKRKLGHPINIRYIISSLAVFGAIWSIISMIITAIWYITPFSSLELMHSIRWALSLIALLLLIMNGNILINKY
jgi:hypothetical protein